MSLDSQRTDTIDVVISDDSDGEDSARTREVAETFGCRYVVGPRRGLYANRNALALAARTSHIRTMDDDHEFPPGHIDACLAAIVSDPDAVWVLSELRPGDPTGDGRGTPPGQLNARGFSQPPAPGGPCWAIADGATIYPRSIFTRGHRLVEDFTYGAAYLEFGSRLHSAGFRIQYLPDTYVVHHWEPRKNFDRRTDLASTFFAMLAHSLVHQRTPRNVALMIAEMGKQFVLHPIIVPGSLRRGLAVYRRYGPMVRNPACGHPTSWPSRARPAE